MSKAHSESAYHLFTKAVEYWSALLCPDYEVRTKQANLAKDTFAEAETDSKYKISNITLNSRRKNLTPHFLDVTAFHEVLHAVFSQIDNLLEPYYAPEYIDALTHDIINRLEKIVPQNEED